MQRKLVVVFDLDGVLVPIRSSWEYLHKFFGVYDEVHSRINIELFYRGLITYDEWMRNDLMLLTSRGCIRYDQIVEAFKELSLNDGAEYVCSYLREVGAELAIVSGGIDILAELVGGKLGIKRIYANKLVFDENGCLLPRGNEVVNPLAKDVIIKRLSHELNIPLKDFIYVGDTTWDLSAFKVVNYPVIYKCSECKDILTRLGIKHYEIISLYELINVVSDILPS